MVKFMSINQNMFSNLLQQKIKTQNSPNPNTQANIRDNKQNSQNNPKQKLKINKKKLVYSLAAAAGVAALAAAFVYFSKGKNIQFNNKALTNLPDSTAETLTNSSELLKKPVEIKKPAVDIKQTSNTTSSTTRKKGTSRKFKPKEPLEQKENKKHIPYVGIYKTKNKKGDDILLEISDGKILKSTINGNVFKEYSYDTRKIGNYDNHQISQYESGSLLYKYDIKKYFNSDGTMQGQTVTKNDLQNRKTDSITLNENLNISRHAIKTYGADNKPEKSIEKYLTDSAEITTYDNKGGYKTLGGKLGKNKTVSELDINDKLAKISRVEINSPQSKIDLSFNEYDNVLCFQKDNKEVRLRSFGDTLILDDEVKLYFEKTSDGEKLMIENPAYGCQRMMDEENLKSKAQLLQQAEKIAKEESLDYDSAKFDKFINAFAKKMNAPSDIKNAQRVFFDKNNKEVQGVVLKNGIAFLPDGEKFSGIMKTKNKKGDSITLEFAPKQLKSLINGNLYKSYLYNNNGVDIFQFDKTGGQKEAIYSIKNNKRKGISTLRKKEFLNDGKVKMLETTVDKKYGLLEKSQKLYTADDCTHLISSLVSSFEPEKNKVYIAKTSFLPDGQIKKTEGGWNNAIKKANDVNMDTKIDNITNIAYKTADDKNLVSGSFSKNHLSYAKSDEPMLTLSVPDDLDGRASIDNYIDYYVHGKYLPRGKNIEFYSFDEKELSESQIKKYKKIAENLNDSRKFFEKEGIDYNKEYTNKFIDPFIEFFKNL